MANKTRFLLRLIILLATTIGGIWAYKLYTEPSNQRSAKSWVHPLRLIQDFKRCHNINRRGLDMARFSGSGSLPLNFLDKVTETLGSNLYIVNGLPGDVWHINGRHIRQLCYEFDGVNLTASKKRQGLQCRLRQLIFGVPFSPDKVPPHLIHSQAQRMNEESIQYMAPLPENWTSEWEYVEELLKLFEDTDSRQTHLHFHCEYGKGRTTTLMALYDIYLNSNEVPIEDIIDRQYCLGGEDLSSTVAHKKGTWTQDALVDRKSLVYAFYDFMQSPLGHKQSTWSQWIKQKQLEQYPNLPIGTKDSRPHRKNDRV